MRLSMNTRRELTLQAASRYRSSTKKEKGQMLNEFVHATGYNRSYAATVLRGYGRKIITQSKNESLLYKSNKKRRKGGGRPPVYTQNVKDIIFWIWELFGYKCAKLLVPIIHNNIDNLQKEKPVSELCEADIKALKKISPSTVDRILRPHRKRLNIKGNSYTLSQTALLTQIPIRTFGDWKNVSAGHFQIDCVGHDGGLVSGQCCFTLTAVDVLSGWCERRAILNRAHRWVIEAIESMRADSPVPFVEIHPDNGSEFINHAMVQYCKKEPTLKISRSRPGNKNDNCYVEQKNFDAVRKLVGYARYTTPESLILMNKLYHVQGLLQNYVYPVHKLLEKTRMGARYRKIYDAPKTPAMRLLEEPGLENSIKQQIIKIQSSINPVALAKQVKKIQSQLMKHAQILNGAYPEK